MSVKTVSDDNFSDFIVSDYVIVDFYASWCGPCKMLAPIFEDLSKDFEGEVVFTKIDTEENSRVSSLYEVSSIPTVILFKNGKEIDRFVGLKDADEFKKFIKGHL